MPFQRLSTLPAAALALALLAGAAATAMAAPTALQVPVEHYALPNGLKVVLSRDTTTPTAVVAVYYNIGFRNEPKERTGFAHLFEHMMFQGSRNLGKMEFVKLVESNGGLLNGSTRFDFTNYFQVVPSHVARDDPLGGGRPHARPRHRAREPEEPAGGREERGQGQRAEPAVRRVPDDRPPHGRQPELVQRPQLLRRPAAPRRGDTRRRAAVLQDVLRAEQRRARHVAATSMRRRPGAGSRSTSATFPSATLPPPPGPARAAAGEGEARRAHRSAGQPTGARHRLSRARAEHAAVVRLRPARSAAGAGPRFAAVRRAGAEAGAHRRRGRRHQLRARATCSTTSGPMLWTSQFFHDAGVPSDRLVQAFDNAVGDLQSRAGGPGDARSRAREDAIGALRQPRAVRGVRPREPAGRRSRCSTTTRRASTASRRSSPR